MIKNPNPKWLRNPNPKWLKNPMIEPKWVKDFNRESG